LKKIVVDMKIKIIALLAVLTVTIPAFSRAQATTPAFSVILHFNHPYGDMPQAGLVADQAGNLYGTTVAGGIGTECSPTNCGTVFKLTRPAPGKSAWTYRVLHHFRNGSDGAFAFAPLYIAGNGVIFGTTQIGGHAGTVFKMTPAAGGTYTYRVIHVFSGGIRDGEFPIGGVALDGQGAVYVPATEGGAQGLGALMKLTPAAGGKYTPQLLRTMYASTGSRPSATMLPVGNTLYGMTEEGGNHNVGVVYSLTRPPQGTALWTYKVLHTFAGYPTDGQFGRSKLVRVNSLLYGTTIQGGVNNIGVIFAQSLPTAGRPNGVYKVVHHFDFPEGGNIYSSLISFNGSLYGVASSNGAYNKGTVFRFTPYSPGHPAKFTVLHSFNGTDGEDPMGILTPGPNGMLYGTTSRGGLHNGGTVFAVRP
jgi:uncharacterized repeat protein (TIGR03803 family)